MALKQLICVTAFLITLGQAPLAQGFFGYVAVACGHDDPFDASTKSDYADEVAGFTNANHACLPGNPALWAETLARTAARYDPVLTVEGLFFYLADEPTLRGIPASQIARAGDIVHATYPQARTMMVEAFRPEGPAPIPASVDFWGFDAYTVRDPAKERLYTAFLSAARLGMRPGQRVFLVLDAQHTPIHADAGLTVEDMADVARATYAFAQAEGDIAGIPGYTWAGGIDNLAERGLRDLPQSVIAVHREIGQAILATGLKK